jgi:hypothetical protein
MIYQSDREYNEGEHNQYQTINLTFNMNICLSSLKEVLKPPYYNPILKLSKPVFSRVVFELPGSE